MKTLKLEFEITDQSFQRLREAQALQCCTPYEILCNVIDDESRDNFINALMILEYENIDSKI
jgi:hypothetical protein